MPFANFTRCEAMGFSTTEQGFGVRLTDKMSRLSTFCEGGVLKVADESIEDTILDIINYVILFYGYIQSKRETTDGTKTTTISGERDAVEAVACCR